MLPPKGMHSRTLSYFSDRIPLSEPAAAARPLYDILEMLVIARPLMAAERKQDCRGLASKSQCLARKIRAAWLLRTKARRDKCFFNPDLVGRVVGYAMAHDQDGDGDIHKAAATLGRRRHLRCPNRFDAPCCVCFGVMCKGNSRKPYLRQTASAVTLHGILRHQHYSEEQSDQPDTWGQSDRNFTPDLCWKILHR